MKVHVHPADRRACGSLRLVWPAETLAAGGCDVEIAPPLEGVYETVAGGRTPVDALAAAARGDVRAVLRGMVPPGCDVVVFQRPMQRHLVDAIPHLQAHGVAVVVEIDDDFHALPAANVAFAESHPRRDADHNRDWLRRACLLADLVTCTTPALAARYAPHGRHAVIPNFVPARYLQIRRAPSEGLSVGWSGSMLVHAGDLAVTRGAIPRAARRAGADVRIVGTGVGVAGELGGPILASGQVDLADYPVALAALDVGVVPLADNQFNMLGKSALKGLEMASLGVPFVASPSADYRRLHALGLGILADRPRDWEREVSRLLTDRSLRRETSERGRQIARSLTIEANAERWWEAWTAAVEHRIRARLVHVG